MEKTFSKLKTEAERIVLPDECEENDRAVRFLALETGVGHYDDLNLLVMAVLIIFISVSFLAVNGGKINDDDKLTFKLETFLSGEFTTKLEEKYIESLPITEEIKAAEERVSLLYGFGNTVSEKKGGNYSSGSSNYQPSGDGNIFESDKDDGFSENAVTTKAVSTDKDGNTVTEKENAETAPGGGTTAVARPPLTQSATTTTEPDEEEYTTTNNMAPSVTTTTTEVTNHTTTTENTDTSEPTDTTVPTETEPTETEPDDTEPDDTEPPADDEPAE